MSYVIKVESGYVKSGKEDTPNIKEAKQFDTKKQANTFAFTNCSGSYYRIVDMIDEKIN
jgi:hypothetical protein